MKRIFVVGILFAVLTDPSVRADALIEQTFLLRPGWNSIYLEVEPAQNDVPTIFAGLPVVSVWTRITRTSTAEYIQDESEGVINRPSWLGWIPGTPPGVSNLFAVQANRAYLVKLSGDKGMSLTVMGRPSLRSIDWPPDALHLTGLPVDPQPPITFATYFAPSAAHAGRPIFKIQSDGAYELVNAANETIGSSRAYWIFSRGASNYTGPLAIELDQGDGLDYDQFALERRMGIRKLAGAESGVQLRVLDPSVAGQLAYWSLEPEGFPEPGKIRWPDLPPVVNLPTAVGSLMACPDPAATGGLFRCDFRLAVQRAKFTSNLLETVLEITDGAGARRWIPLRALRREEAAGATAGATNEFAGLWLGTVEVKAVSEARTGSLAPTPVSTAFGFRIIVHVDGAGQTRLLKEVVQMWEDGVTNPDGTLHTPGRYVLLTDASLFSQFQGATLRDGDPVGVRISSAAYDFDGNQRLLSGAFGFGGSLIANLVLPATASTNPYRHNFHPDHDNLDASFAGQQIEAYEVTRQITLAFSSKDPSGRDTPDWGDAAMGGTYQETLSGLHRHDIAVQGTFLLSRVTETPVLNE